MAQGEDRLRNDSGHRGPRSREIRADIDRTRASMDRTLDALGSRLTAGHVLSEGWRALKGGTGAGANKVVDLARQHPLPATVIGLGLCWMAYESSRSEGDGEGLYARTPAEAFGGYESERGGIYTDTPAEREGGIVEGAKEAVHSVRDTASRAVEKAGALASQAGDKVTTVASQAGDKVSQAAETVKQKTAEVGTQARQQMRRAGTGASHLLDEQPLLVGVGALALGVIGGLLLPRTRKEDRLLGEARDRVVEGAREAGREALDKSREVARAAADVVKQEAEKRDLTPRGLAEQVTAPSAPARPGPPPAGPQPVPGGSRPEPGPTV